MASSKHHERQPKNPSVRRKKAKTQPLTAKERLIASIRNLRTQNCDWVFGLTSSFDFLFVFLLVFLFLVFFYFIILFCYLFFFILL